MNDLLLCAYHLRKLKPDSGKVEVHILTDTPEKYPDFDCQRMLSPWSAWMNLASIQLPPTNATASELTKMGMSSGQIVITLMDSGPKRQSLEEACKQLGLKFIFPHFSPAGSLDADLIREVSFFDFEFSGKNEWDGKPTVYPHSCLKQLSSTHCKDFYPTWAFEPLIGLQRGPRKELLKVMDIGCGPVSVLRWGAIRGEITITGLDPLIDLYAVVLARHGLDALPKIRCDRELNGFAEDMPQLISDDDFDVIYTQNALDHTQNPAVVIENISKKLAPKGLMAFQVATREGTRQKWDQLHKTDIYLEGDKLMFNHQHTPPQPLLPLKSGLRLKTVISSTADWLACVVEKA